MPQRQGDYQVQEERQQNRLSQLQLEVVRLVEMPLGQLEQHVKNEVEENFVFDSSEDDWKHDSETGGPEYSSEDSEEGYSSGDREDEYSSGDDAEELDGRGEERQDYADGEGRDASFDDYASVDDVPSYLYNQHESSRQEIPLGDTRSFGDELIEQVGEYDLNEHEQQLMNYLIGSLNDKGFIDTTLSEMVDNLMIYEGIDTDEREMESLLNILQQFDPPGIGARSLQECLLIQLQRIERYKGHEYDLERRIITECYEEFLNQSKETLAARFNVQTERISRAFEVLSHLNPHPGTALCESVSGSSQTVIPDFFIETDGEGNISMTLNNGEIPELHVSRKYEEQLKKYQKCGNKMPRSEREAFKYTQNNVERARLLINAIRQRNSTLKSTMNAIIECQREFILTQDESTLNTLRLQDIAERVKLDLSTVSRVQNSKYVSIDGHIYPLKIFFKRVHTNAQGEVFEHTEIMDAIRQLIEGEDRTEPLTDSRISEILSSKGWNIKRRTIAKYRETMGIPSTVKRKDFVKTR